MKQIVTTVSVLVMGTAVWADTPPHRARTSAVFSLASPAGASVTAGNTFDLVVAASIDERLAGCAFRLSAEGAAATIVSRVPTAGLQYLNGDPAAPLADGLPRRIDESTPADEVLLNLDSADPPGGPQDGVPPGTDVELVVFQVRADQPGTLRLSISHVSAVETQSDPDGQLFAASVDPARSEILLTVTGGPDLNGDERVDLLDFASLQACFASAPTGACNAADIDGDGEVDGQDHALLLACLSGPAASPTCGTNRTTEEERD